MLLTEMGSRNAWIHIDLVSANLMCKFCSNSQSLLRESVLRQRGRLMCLKEPVDLEG